MYKRRNRRRDRTGLSTSFRKKKVLRQQNETPKTVQDIPILLLELTDSTKLGPTLHLSFRE